MSEQAFSVGILASGALGAEVLNAVGDELDIRFICTDKQSAEILAYAESKNILCYAGNPRGGKALDVVGHSQVDVLLSINYLFLIEQDLIDFPQTAAINFHGSLLPAYRGRTPHVWAIINGEKETGITAHKIVQECDAGDIVLQKRVPIGRDDTGADILERFKEQYPELVRQVVQHLEQGRPCLKQDASLATYFGKRTPDDGRIVWSWYRDRIRNWVRAQAPPYPGAFSYCEGEKIGIFKAELSNMGFQGSDLDGLILKHTGDALFVKAADGVLEISSFEDSNNVLVEGKVLS